VKQKLIHCLAGSTWLNELGININNIKFIVEVKLWICEGVNTHRVFSEYLIQTVDGDFGCRGSL